MPTRAELEKLAAVCEQRARSAKDKEAAALWRSLASDYGSQALATSSAAEATPCAKKHCSKGETEPFE
jgi:hypothetical protein